MSFRTLNVIIFLIKNNYKIINAFVQIFNYDWNDLGISQFVDIKLLKNKNTYIRFKNITPKVVLQNADPIIVSHKQFNRKTSLRATDIPARKCRGQVLQTLRKDIIIKNISYGKNWFSSSDFK